MREWMRKLREDKGLSVDSAALKIGISASFLEKIERGERCGSVKTVKSIADVYGFDWTSFFDDKKEAML